MLGSLRERGKQFSTWLRRRHWRIHEFSLSGTSTSCRPFVKVQSRNKIRLAQWCCDLTFQWFVGNYSLNHDILNWTRTIISNRVLCELFRRQIDRISPQLLSSLYYCQSYNKDLWLLPSQNRIRVFVNVKVEVLWIVGWLMIWSDRNFPIFWWDLNKEPSGRHREQRALAVPASYWCTWTLASLYLFVFWAAGRATVQTWGQSWCFCWLTEGSDRLAYFLLSSLRCKNFNLTWRTLKSCSVKTSRCLPWV